MQRSLFDEIDLEHESKLTPEGDPGVPIATAQQVAPKLGKAQMEVLSAFRRSVASLTSSEAAEVCRRSTKENAKMREACEKRCIELEQIGLLRCVGTRTCGITGNASQHYVAADWNTGGGF